MMKKIGLVLGGGGAKGAYQVGVLKALEEHKLLRHVRYFSGTSIGAINGFLLMNKINMTRLGLIWNEFNNDIIYGKNKWRETFSIGLYNTDGIVEKIKPYFNEKAFKKSKIKGYVTLAEVPNKGFFATLSRKNYVKDVIFLNETSDPLGATLASAAIPFVFGKKEFEGTKYVDGGMVDNFPLDPLLNEGVNIILSIGLSVKSLPTEVIPNVLHINFTPLEDFGSFAKTSLDFSPAKISNYYEQGYEDSKRLIRYLKQNKYLWFFGRIRLRKNRLVTLKDLEPLKLLK
ncbi:MAG: patatin-like phospholipase family protein [Bacilli bacterium]|nr:patatin-like phospholipase family protein [Bacilli bacterium]